VLPGSTYGYDVLAHIGLQRTGAWEFLPRPPAEARCLATLREVPVDQLAQEQQRLRQHQERFACTRDPFDESMSGLINSVNSGSLWQLRPQGDFCGIAFSMT
jgi:hypothetical protein